VRPEFIAPFPAGEIEMLAANHHDRFKFWKKKSEVVRSGHRDRLRPRRGWQIANLFDRSAASFLHDGIFPQRVRVELMS
jgi:hypothetical protein